MSNPRKEPTRTREQGTRVTQTKSGDEIIAACQAIKDAGQYAKINGVMIDLFSASAILTVDNACSEANRVKFRALPVVKMAKLAFKLIK